MVVSSDLPMETEYRAAQRVRKNIDSNISYVYSFEGSADGAEKTSLLLQAVDLAPHAAGSRFQLAPWRLRSPTWALARGHYDLLALDPPQIFVEDSTRCRGAVYGDDEHWAPLAYVAYAQGLAVNSAQLARGAVRLLDAACDEQIRALDGGRLRPRTVYVVHPTRVPVLERAGAVCGEIEGYRVCVSAEQRDAFRSALASR